MVEAVWKEVTAHKPAALSDTRLQRIPDPVAQLSQLAPWHLDQGESASLSHALTSPARVDRLVLCDELAARQACRALSLPVVGSLGLIVEAHNAGHVSADLAVMVLNGLRTRGCLHITPKLIAQAIAAVESNSGAAG